MKNKTIISKSKPPDVREAKSSVMEVNFPRAPIVLVMGENAKEARGKPSRQRPQAASVLGGQTTVESSAAEISTARPPTRKARSMRALPRRRRHGNNSLCSTRTPSEASSVAFSNLSVLQRRRVHEILSLRFQTRGAVGEPENDFGMQDILREASRKDPMGVHRTLQRAEKWKRDFDERFPSSVEGNLAKMAQSTTRAKLGKSCGSVAVFDNGVKVRTKRAPRSDVVAERTLRRFEVETRVKERQDLTAVKDVARVNTFAARKRKTMRSLRKRQTQNVLKEKLAIGAFGLMEDRLGILYA